jgi:2-polyprenyl-3-methyl-5-hydroxy-6-metoxy-1,4-benzoquinol methylase
MDQYNLDVSIEQYDKYGSEYIKKRISDGSLFNDYIEAPIVRKLIMDHKGIRGKNALDVGCGPGIYAKALASMNMSVTAIDPSSTMIDAAKNYCNGMKNIDFHQKKLEDFSTKKSFNLILATFMIGYFNDLEKSFGLMKNHLSSGGKIITSSLHPERLFSSGRNSIGYISGVSNRDLTYEADFLGPGKSIQINRYSIEDIFHAAKQAGLKINNLYEPYLDIESSYPDKEKVDFYSRNHSVIIFELARK